MIYDILDTDKYQTEITPESKLSGLTLDSLDMMELNMKIENHFNITIPNNEVTRVTTINEYCELIYPLIEAQETIKGTFITQDDINEYFRYNTIHRRFESISKSIFHGILHLNPNVLQYRKDSIYKGFTLTQKGLNIEYIQPTVKHTGVASIHVPTKLLTSMSIRLITETIVNDFVLQDRWKKLPDDTRKMTRDKYQSLISNPDQTDFIQGQIKLLEEMYGKDNLLTK